MRTIQNAAMQHTSSAARDIGRDANELIARIIGMFGVNLELTAIGSKADVDDKIDGVFRSGPFEGKTVQMIRRIAKNSRDDYAIQIVSKRPNESVLLDTD